MNILVTAGNTQVLIDKVRCLTNIFTGRTGAAIAVEAYRRGHSVTLHTSHPEVVREISDAVNSPDSERWHISPYQTFEDLFENLHKALRTKFDAIVHCAAVSDYLSGGVYAPAPGTSFREDLTWHQESLGKPALVDRAAGKVKSDESELWLRLVRAPKIIDKFRQEWGFDGILVKFKLEVGLTEEALLEIAERSRRQSSADVMVANTLEGSREWALLGTGDGTYQRVERRKLPGQLLDLIEMLHQERRRG